MRGDAVEPPCGGEDAHDGDDQERESHETQAISAFADQAVGGAFLLLPGLVDLVVMSPLFFRWLGQLEEKAKIADQRRQEEEEALLEAEQMGETSEA